MITNKLKVLNYLILSSNKWILITKFLVPSINKWISIVKTLSANTQYQEINKWQVRITNQLKKDY